MLVMTIMIIVMMMMMMMMMLMAHVVVVECHATGATTRLESCSGIGTTGTVDSG